LVRPIFGLLLVPLILWNGILAFAMLKVHMNDFGKLYYSAVFFTKGEDIYKPSPATSIPIGRSHNKEFSNLNPPHALLAVLPLAKLSPLLALAIWSAASIICASVSVRLIVREVGLVGSFDPMVLASVVLAFVGTQSVIMTGQLSLLLFLPATLAWLEGRRGRWGHAGVYLGGLMSLKLFLLIFLPYLCLRGRIRAACTAVLTALALFGGGILVFGTGPYGEWIRQLRAVDWTGTTMNGSLAGLLARGFGQNPQYRLLLTSPRAVEVALIFGVGTIGIVTIWASTRDTTCEAVDRAFALLILGALLISPLGWIYYIWLGLGPMAALWMSARGNDQPSGRTARLSRSLGCVGTAIFFLPIVVTGLFQPSRVMAATLGSIYFWGLLALWSAVVADWALRGHARMGRRRDDNPNDGAAKDIRRI
jgi:hypothetical protein